jgi:nicotinamide-nucleotide amidase
VSSDVLETFGAVSIATAWAMAQGASSVPAPMSRGDHRHCRAGRAGSPRKPVGTVIFARARRGADPKEIVADVKDFGDLGRGGIRLQAALCALELLMPAAPSP